MVHELPSNKPRMRGKRSRYPKWMAKEILKDALSGLAFLHKNGVTHGDLQPGNLLFSIRQLESISEEELQHDKTNLTEPLRRLDGKTDKWAPRYLALGQSLYGYVDLGVVMAVKISDLGAGTQPPLPSPFKFLQV
jgi:serine/threonine protein kinase